MPLRTELPPKSVPQHQCEKNPSDKHKELLHVLYDFRRTEYVTEISRGDHYKIPCHTQEGVLFFRYLERKLKTHQTQVNFFLNKKSTPWFKVLDFTTYWLPTCKKLILPFLNALLQTSLQQSTCETLAFHMPWEKVWGRKTISVFPCDGACNKNKNCFYQTVKQGLFINGEKYPERVLNLTTNTMPYKLDVANLWYIETEKFHYLWFHWEERLLLIKG